MGSATFAGLARAAAVAMVFSSSLLGGRFPSYAAPALACPCAPPQGPPTGLLRGYVVFTGTVTAIKTVSYSCVGNTGNCQYYPESEHPTSLEVDFAIERSWGGARASLKGNVYTGIDAASCEYPFEVGGKYLVQASQNRAGLFWTCTCYRTKPLAEAGAELAVLDGGDLPASGDGSATHSFSSQIAIVMLALLSSSGFAILGGRFFIRQKSGARTK